MSERDEKLVRRTRHSFLYGAIALLCFFPYENLTWNFSLFLLALFGMLAGAITLIKIGSLKRAAEDEIFEIPKILRAVGTAAYVCVLVAFVIAVILLICTGILYCAVVTN